jgi:hypothetical protein
MRQSAPNLRGKSIGEVQQWASQELITDYGTTAVIGSSGTLDCFAKKVAAREVGASFLENNQMQPFMAEIDPRRWTFKSGDLSNTLPAVGTLITWGGRTYTSTLAAPSEFTNVPEIHVWGYRLLQSSSLDQVFDAISVTLWTPQTMVAMAADDLSLNDAGYTRVGTVSLYTNPMSEDDKEQKYGRLDLRIDHVYTLVPYPLGTCYYRADTGETWQFLSASQTYPGTGLICARAQVLAAPPAGVGA